MDAPEPCGLPEREEVLARVDAELIAQAAGIDLYVAPFDAASCAVWERFQLTAVATPFQRLEWVRAWIAAKRAQVGRRRIDPLVVFGFEGPRLALLFPLARERRFLHRRLVWLAHSVNDYNAPLVDPHALERLNARDADTILRTIIGGLPKLAYAFFNKQPLRVSGYANPFAKAAAMPFSANAHALDLHPGWPQVYTRACRPRRRQRDRYKLRKLANGAPIALRRARAPDELASLLDLLFAWKAERLESQGAPRNPFADDHFKRFVKSLLDDRGSHDLVRLYVLERGGEPVAASVVLLQNRTFNYFITAFDPSIDGNCSPGRALLLKLIELAARAGLHRFDFSTGDEPYKLEWCDEHLELTFATYPRTGFGIGAAQAAALRVHVKRIVKNTPLLLRLLMDFNRARQTGPRGLVRGVSRRRK